MLNQAIRLISDYAFLNPKIEQISTEQNVYKSVTCSHIAFVFVPIFKFSKVSRSFFYHLNPYQHIHKYKIVCFFCWLDNEIISYELWLLYCEKLEVFSSLNYELNLCSFYYAWRGHHLTSFSDLGIWIWLTEPWSIRMTNYFSGISLNITSLAICVSWSV